MPKAMTSETELEDLVHEYEAQIRWARGDVASYSSNIVDQLTCGYGKLDSSGEFQFPLRPAEKYLELDRARRYASR